MKLLTLFLDFVLVQLIHEIVHNEFMIHLYIETNKRSTDNSWE